MSVVDSDDLTARRELMQTPVLLVMVDDHPAGQYQFTDDTLGMFQ
jgi:hypothetical protein